MSAILEKGVVLGRIIHENLKNSYLVRRKTVMRNTVSGNKDCNYCKNVLTGLYI